jgi:hypothetical protein
MRGAGRSPPTTINPALTKGPNFAAISACWITVALQVSTCGGVLPTGDPMQEARQTQNAKQTSGAFSNFVTAQKEKTPSVVRLMRGLEESTLFKAFQY